MDDAGTIADWTAAERDQAKAGEEGFRRLYEATSRPLWAYLRQASGRADVADDLVQETYCRYLLKKTPAMGEAETRAYLFRMATNLLHDRYRRRDEMAAGEGAEECPVEGAAADEAARLDVRAAMRQLKPRERELLWLAYVEGMSHAEIAAATGLNAMSIRILLFRARRKAGALLRPQRATR